MTTDLKWSKFMQLELINALYRFRRVIGDRSLVRVALSPMASSGHLLRAHWSVFCWWGGWSILLHSLMLVMIIINAYHWWWLMFSDLAHGWGWHPGLEDDWRKSCLSSLLHHQPHQPWLLVSQILITLKTCLLLWWVRILQPKICIYIITISLGVQRWLIRMAKGK